ncbi:HAD family hydrolase [Nocardioides zhouii]|uniref:HAD family hydrolase n=1 Tax=Nocardioides zhouii TaxID=1168729 RepID=A0A4Q2SPB5_9ACTN|nr:HAD family hydrolase [Nocardioides zhouii]RYC05938.1 HAD family hydrolase [Nocardioides zhouii]
MTSGPVPRLVLWDIDGTLVSNNDSDEGLFVAALESVLGPRPEVVHPYRHGKTDLQQVTEYVLGNGGSADDVPEGMQALVVASRAHFSEPGERIALPGVARVLAELAAAGHVNALLTGNGRERAELKLRSAGLEASQFDLDRSFFGGHTPSRPALATSAAAWAAEHDLVPVLVGDTVADADAAAAAGITFVGVATGVYSVDQLEEAQHALVLSDLADAEDVLLDLLAGECRSSDQD